MQSALNTLLIDIYRTARGMASSRFKEAVFERLRAHLDFDAAGWGTSVSYTHLTLPTRGLV